MSWHNRRAKHTLSLTASEYCKSVFQTNSYAVTNAQTNYIEEKDGKLITSAAKFIKERSIMQGRFILHQKEVLSTK